MGQKSRTKFLEDFAKITSIAIKSIANLAKNHMVAKNNLSPLRQSRRNAKSPGTLGAGLELGRVQTLQTPCGACPPRLFHQITEH